MLVFVEARPDVRVEMVDVCPLTVVESPDTVVGNVARDVSVELAVARSAVTVAILAFAVASPVVSPAIGV